MGKLLKLKQWLTLADTAKHLEIVFGEPVSVADILRFALDGQIILSTHLVNHARGRIGRIIDICDTTIEMLPSLQSNSTNYTEVFPVIKELRIKDDKFAKLSENSTSVSGIWDLSMAGAESLDVEHQYQALTGGPEVTLNCLEGVLLMKDGDVICQLQENLDENEYEVGSRKFGQMLEQLILSGGISGAEAEERRNTYRINRAKFLERIKRDPESAYYPAGQLPSDAVIVVRSSEIRRFEDEINGIEAKDEVCHLDQPLDPRSERTYQTIIGAMLELLVGENKPYPKQSALVAELVEKNKRGMSERTLNEKLPECRDIYKGN